MFELDKNIVLQGINNHSDSLLLFIINIVNMGISIEQNHACIGTDINCIRKKSYPTCLQDSFRRMLLMLFQLVIIMVIMSMFRAPNGISLVPGVSLIFVLLPNFSIFYCAIKQFCINCMYRPFLISWFLICCHACYIYHLFTEIEG
jgi:hypothetical protein